MITWKGYPTIPIQYYRPCKNKKSKFLKILINIILENTLVYFTSNHVLTNLYSIQLIIFYVNWKNFTDKKNIKNNIFLWLILIKIWFQIYIFSFDISLFNNLVFNFHGKVFIFIFKYIFALELYIRN